VSRDGSYLAENTTHSTIAADNRQSIIYGPDGSVVAHLADLVVGFSWDGSTVVAQDELSGPAMVVAWRTANIVWSAPPPPSRPPTDVRFEAQPDGSGLAIWVGLPVPTQGGVGRYDLYVVGSDGQVIASIRNTT